MSITSSAADACPALDFCFREHDVAFQKLSHQAIHGSPRGTHELQNLRAIALFGKGPRERFYLTLDALCSNISFSLFLIA